MSGSINGVISKSDSLFTNRDTLRAINWLGNHSEPDDIILASTQNGLHIPAIINRRVIYGHPIESIIAADRSRVIDDAFAGDKDGLAELITSFPIRFVLVDKLDLVTLEDIETIQFALVGKWNGVQVYEVKR